MKDNFLLKKSYQEVVDSLTDEDAGKLFKGILKYVNTNDSKLEGLLKTIFIPMKNDIDKNEDNYQKKCKKNKENIEKRWNEKNEDIRTYTNVYESIPNDTDNNHISYITNHLEEEKDNRGMGEEEKGETFKTIVNYLNKKTNSNFKPTSRTTKEKINARLNEGYKTDDFIVVIDNKTSEWLGTEFEKYLCPETLFGTKFEKYLNQKRRSEKTPEWFDKEIQSKEATEEELQEFKERLRGIH